MPLMQWNLSKYQKREMIDQLGKLKEELQKTLRSQEQGSIIPSAALKLYEEEQHLRQKIQEFQTILIPLLKEAYIKEKSSRRNNDKALRKELPRKIKAMKKKKEEKQCTKQQNNMPQL